MTDVLKGLSHKYNQYVTQNVDLVGNIESVCKVLSYVVAGRFENGAVLSELLYSASNLLVLLNDTCIRKAAGIELQFPKCQHRLLHWLTVLEYVEVFLELGGDRVWGQIGRWVIIVCVQLAKAIMRLILLKKHKIGVQPTPPVQALNRQKQLKKAQQQKQEAEEEDFTKIENDEEVEQTFQLKSSGKVVRSLAAAPPLSQRTWTLPGQASSSKKADQPQGGETVYDCKPTRLNPGQVRAELLHIVRPLAHLLGISWFGEDSWKPWFVACGFDVTSLCLIGSPTEFNPVERAELKRRTVYLLLYMLRSPFYDKYTKAQAAFLLTLLARNIPGMSLLAQPLLDYLPVWQKIYAYVWAM